MRSPRRTSSVRRQIGNAPRGSGGEDGKRKFHRLGDLSLLITPRVYFQLENVAASLRDAGASQNLVGGSSLVTSSVR